MTGLKVNQERNKQWNLIKLSDVALLLHHNEILPQYDKFPVIEDALINELLNSSQMKGLTHTPKSPRAINGDGSLGNTSLTKSGNLGEDILKLSHRAYTELTKWLWDNHKDVLEEWEKKKWVRIEYLHKNASQSQYVPLDCVACEDGTNMEDLRFGERCASCGRKKENDYAPPISFIGKEPEKRPKEITDAWDKESKERRKKAFEKVEAEETNSQIEKELNKKYE